MARFNWLGGLALAVAAACGGTTVKGNSTGSLGTTSGGGLLGAGAQCIANDACASGVCDVNGAGNCCSHACSTEDAVCGASDCDSSGTCSYPKTTTTCGRCFDGMLTPGTCNGLGLCSGPGTPGPCPSHLGCNATLTGCNTTCSVASDCASGYYCSSGACVPQIALGSCAENDACSSGICGVIGTGHCCTSGCANTATPCGAIDCDDSTGACTFSDNSIGCGPAASCTGNTLNAAGNCDGHGGCSASAVDCTPFVCGDGACAASCADSSSCVGGAFCDVAAATCCPALMAGGTLNVDGLNGNDLAGCCGFNENTPCLTIGRAMQIVDSAGVEGVTLNLSLGGGNQPVTGAWAPVGEKYPIVLGWGVELFAPGLAFADPYAGILYNDAGVPSDGGSAHGEIFDIAQYSSRDTIGYSSIVGTAGYPLSVGIAGFGKYTPDPSSIQVEPGQTLYLANANVNGDANGSANGITVLGEATLLLGQDRSGVQVGPVNVGQGGGGITKGVYHNDGWIGIDCQGCTLQDSNALAGQTALTIQGQIFADIRALDGSTITLTDNPIVGAAPGATSFNTCMSKQDVLVGQAAVLLEGMVTMTFDNGHVQCIAGDGFKLTSSTMGAPVLKLDNTTIQNTEQAILAVGGTATVSSSTIQFNYNGVEQTDGGTVDLSGGGLGGTNTVVCSNSFESIHGTGGIPGVDVLNTNGTTLNASDVAWDTPGPDLFSCNAALTTCTCEIGSCVNPGGKDGMDAVYTASGTVTTTGASQSSVSCVPICFGSPLCAAGTTCCSTSAYDTKSMCLGPGKGCL